MSFIPLIGPLIAGQAGNILTATAVGGSLLGSLGQMNQAKFQQELSEDNARRSRQSAIVETNRQRRDNRRRAGATRAQLGAAGLSATGNALDILADQAANQAEDEALVRFRGATRTAGFRSQAQLASRARTGALLAAPFQAVGAGLQVQSILRRN
jgi:hypothetical protein